MKNIFCFFLLIIEVHTFAQNCDLPLQYEGNTGSNMTILISSEFVQSVNLISTSSYIVAITSSDLVVGSACLSDDCLEDGMQQLTLWRDDALTPELDGALEGESIVLKLVNGADVFMVTPQVTLPNGLEITELTFITNGLMIMIDASYSYLCAGIIEGCTNEFACNYNPVANQEDGSCEYPEVYYDCFGFCFNDFDQDGVCDELEVYDCMEPMACNYNYMATNPLECFFPDLENCETCSGESDGSGIIIINDFNGDGICDYMGCMDSLAANYNPLATEDDGFCEFLSLVDTKNLGVIIYPNPGSHILYIKNSQYIPYLKISLVNILGDVVLSSTLEEVYSQEISSINTQNLMPGTYIVNLVSSSKTYYLFWLKH